MHLLQQHCITHHVCMVAQKELGRNKESLKDLVLICKLPSINDFTSSTTWTLNCSTTFSRNTLSLHWFNMISQICPRLQFACLQSSSHGTQHGQHSLSGTTSIGSLPRSPSQNTRAHRMYIPLGAHGSRELTALH